MDEAFDMWGGGLGCLFKKTLFPYKKNVFKLV